MEIVKNIDGDILNVKLSGRLDAVTAPQFDKAMIESLDSVKKVTIDLQELEYVASAGLRSLMMVQKKIDQKDGEMVIRNVQPQVMEVLDMTGFDEILTIEK